MKETSKSLHHVLGYRGKSGQLGGQRMFSLLTLCREATKMLEDQFKDTSCLSFLKGTTGTLILWNSRKLWTKIS